VSKARPEGAPKPEAKVKTVPPGVTLLTVPAKKLAT
jgi:hypothetical protein